MADIEDGYDLYYSDRLWLLLPALYRTADTDQYAAPGPLRELVARLGTQIAVVRRSIDRMWADQSVETCDDWVVPYIGDLLGVNLMAGLDAPAQRTDVGKTIHYRRRKGTIAVLEEIATDVTGWEARIIEGMRRLGRTAHGLDPAIGLPPPPACGSGGTGAMSAPSADLRVTGGLIGLLTGTPAGGFADLRAAHGGGLTGTAFDEYASTADMRAGHGSTGWRAIPRLLVFLWRLTSFGVTGGTPVGVTGCAYQYVFDPTGRQIPLFLRPRPPVDDVDSWVPAREWEVPGQLTASLLRALRDPGGTSPARTPYPDTVAPSYSVATIAADGTAEQIADAELTVWPELGRFEIPATGPPQSPREVSYQFGFAGPLGAGPYDRKLLGDPPAVAGLTTHVAGGTGLDTALAGLASTGSPAVVTGTVIVDDSRTYTPAQPGAQSTVAVPVSATAAPVGNVLIQAGPRQRPVARIGFGAEWVFTGGGTSAQLTLDGLLVSGGDVVLRGTFNAVHLTACTFDPGTAGAEQGGVPPDPFATSADNRPLTPTCLWIEADPAAPAGSPGIRQLVVDHCILGPIRTRNGGTLETLTITDSIVQGLPQSTVPRLTGTDIYDPALFTRLLKAGRDPVSAYLWSQLSAATQADVTTFIGQSPNVPPLPSSLIDDLNQVINGPAIYDPARFTSVNLPSAVGELLSEVEAAGSNASQAAISSLNRMLVEAAYPVAVGTAALALADAAAGVQRVTLLGRMAVHRLSANDSILGDFAVVEDSQHGCVRFSAWAAGSVLPSRYESVQVPAGAPLFTSRDYGDPGYGQLAGGADHFIMTASPAPAAIAAYGAGGVGGATGPTQTSGASVTAGAENGSEMGAFCALLNPVREQALMAKLAEYLPAGLMPLVVHVT